MHYQYFDWFKYTDENTDIPYTHSEEMWWMLNIQQSSTNTLVTFKSLWWNPNTIFVGFIPKDLF